MQQPQKANQYQPSEEFNNFDKAMRKAIAVPKSEIDKREQNWRTEQELKPKRGKKSHKNGN